MDNIGDIISSLSEKDIENLKEAAQSFLGDSQSQKDESSKNNFFPDLGSIDPQMIGKITKIMSGLNKRNERCELISALKPFLSSDKQKRADQAMQIIRIIELIPMLKDQG